MLSTSASLSKSECELHSEFVYAAKSASLLAVILDLEGRKLAQVVTQSERGTIATANVFENWFAVGCVYILVANIGLQVAELSRHLGIEAAGVVSSLRAG